MRRPSRLADFMLAALLMALALSGEARVIHVGPDGEVRRIADAARIARDDDIVAIASGEYRGDVAIWLQKRLTIRGIGQRPVLVADGKDAEGKAIWVIRNGEFEISNIEFRGARVPDHNGAGIRFEGGKLNIRNCVFHDNQNGILTGNREDAELSIENSSFAAAPKQQETLPHLLYAGRIASLRVTGSRFHGGYRGHLIKSRAQRTELRYNLIYDGPNGSASYEVDLPEGGIATLVGNVIGQSAHTENLTLVAYGAETPRWPVNRLELSHNTLLNASPKPAWLVRTWNKPFIGGLEINAINNLLVGIGWLDGGSTGRHRGNFFVVPSVLANPDLLDFRLSRSSWLRGLVAPPADAASPLTPTAEFALPLGSTPLVPLDKWAPGAFQSPAGG